MQINAIILENDENAAKTLLGLFDSNDVLDFSSAARTKRVQLRRPNLKLKCEAFKKRGVHVVQ